jgi:hypothetical protein
MRLLHNVRLCAAASVLVGIACTRVGAQDAAAALPATWGVVAGGVGVTGAYRGYMSSGAAAGLVAQFPLSVRRLSLRGDIMFTWINAYGSDCKFGGAGCAIQSVNGSSVGSASFGLVARLNDPAIRWSPYLIAGAAAYATGATDGEFRFFRPNHLGLQGGVGFEIRPANHTYFVEARYMGMPPGGYAPVLLGIRF